MPSLEVAEHHIALDDEILFVRLRGPLRLPQAQALLAFATDQVKRLPGFFLLLDLRSMGSPPDADSRRLLVQWTKERPPLAAAAFGGNPIVRALATLAIRASSLLSKQDRPLHFFADEAQARDWFAEQRRRSVAASPL